MNRTTFYALMESDFTLVDSSRLLEMSQENKRRGNNALTVAGGAGAGALGYKYRKDISKAGNDAYKWGSKNLTTGYRSAKKHAKNAYGWVGRNASKAWKMGKNAVNTGAKWVGKNPKLALGLTAGGVLAHHAMSKESMYDYDGNLMEMSAQNRDRAQTGLMIGGAGAAGYMAHKHKKAIGAFASSAKRRGMSAYRSGRKAVGSAYTSGVKMAKKGYKHLKGAVRGGANFVSRHASTLGRTVMKHPGKAALLGLGAYGGYRLMRRKDR